MAESQKPKRRRRDSEIAPEPDMMARRLEFSLVCKDLPRVDFNDVDAVKARIDWYFNECIARGIRPGVEGMCNALHTRRQELHKWTTGERRAGQGHREVILDAKQVLADMMEQYMLNGEINPVAGIFLSSNQFDYDRNATVTLQTQQALVADEDPARLADKYRADVIDVQAEPAKLKLPVGESEK